MAYSTGLSMVSSPAIAAIVKDIYGPNPLPGHYIFSDEPGPITIIEFIVAAFANHHGPLLLDSLFICISDRPQTIDEKYIITAHKSAFPVGINRIVCKSSDVKDIDIPVSEHELILFVPTEESPRLSRRGSTAGIQKDNDLIDFACRNWAVLKQGSSSRISLGDYFSGSAKTSTSFRDALPPPASASTCCVIS